MEDGLISARSSGTALTGFDNALRYFALKTNPDIGEISYEIPVRIQKGSWEALIPHTLGGWISGGGGLLAMTYATTAVKEVAKLDLKTKT